MSSIYRSFALLSALWLLTVSALAQTPPIRIMPLGDSITDGSSFDSPDGSGGYRGRLYNLLISAGYNVDYIGSLTVNSGQLIEKEHEGHSGWRIDQLDSNMAGWLSSMADPDVVLMHIGTNDFGQNFNTATAIDRLDALILKIATLRPYAHIIVTNLMERAGAAETNIQSQFNPFVQDRVNAHAAAGRRVTFLDMRAAVPLADMPDNLHPNQTGYDKMSDAWFPAIQAVIGPDGDNAPPAIYRARGGTDRVSLQITFSKPVADTAANPANYSLSDGLTVSAATLDASKRIVTLTTSEQQFSTPYTVTVNGVEDRISPTPNAIAPNSTAQFTAAIPRGYLNNVAEAAGYTLVYSLDVPNVANYLSLQPAYAVDNRNAIGPFSRIAYYVELQTTTGDLQYLWASMDAFTSDVNKIAVPTVGTGAIFQQGAANLNVASNVQGIVTGNGLAGNIEFWPSNYSAGNGAGIPGASDGLFDFGDTRTPSGTYGSMQVHNAAAGQTLFAFNNWGGAGTVGQAEIGIGNSPAGNPDWTFTANAGAYSVKTIQVLVQTTGDLTGPVPVSAQASFGRTSITLTFDEPIAAASVEAANFAIDQGVTVLGARVSPNQREIILSTTPLPVGAIANVAVSGVRDTSPNANLIAPGTSIAVTGPALPPEIATNVGAAAAGYHVVCSLDVPATGNLNALGSSAYRVDDRAAQSPFSRVAYYLELQKPGQSPEYVWVSMDAFTSVRGKLGVPIASTGAVFQQNLSNMEVKSNVAGIVEGTGIATGNIEFWPSNYTQAKNATLSPSNSSDSAYDFGDSGAGSGAGHGSMQIHNAGANQTLFAINNFGVDGQPIAIGIGNRPTADPDWTFAANAGTYTRRVLHVLVLPGTSTPASIVAKAPEAANYVLAYSLNVPAAGNLVSGAGFQDYAVNNSAHVGPFSRVAYYMELQKTGDAEPSYVWVSMDAFTNQASRIGVPTPASGAVFQGPLSNLNARSNVAGVTTGDGIATGNIEFWPTNYTTATPAGVLPGNPGNTSAYDFNDTRSTTGTHGSMQIHNYGAGQTIFALSNWGASGNTANAFGIGIGNSPAGAPDYTLTGNAATYDLKRVLQVYILPGDTDSAGPTIVSATPSSELNRVLITFNEPVAAGTIVPANFSIDGGLTVTGATLIAGNREVALTTTPQNPGTTYNLSVTGIRDRSASANVITPGAGIAFTTYTPPAVLANVPEAADYELIYSFDIPAISGRWNVNPVPYSVDESKFGEKLFDRVAYVMELDSSWVYVSFDPFTNSLSKVGIPSLTVTGTPFQQKVANMNVASNVAGVVTGTGLATGNIEFWGGNYSGTNPLNIPNASTTTLDFGDRMDTGVHGSMQVHNHDLDGDGPGAVGQTIFAYNNWGSNVNATSDTGIGANPNAGSAGSGGTQMPDWTFTGNAPSFATRKLHVLVRPGGTPTGPAPQIMAQPVSRKVNVGGSTSFAVLVNGTGPFAYQWRFEGQPISGATKPWLDVAPATLATEGDYDVVVTSAGGVSTASLAAELEVNALPTFAGYQFVARANTPSVISLTAILAKAADADNDTLSITGASAASAEGGSVSLAGGSLTYTPAADFTGADSFAITVSDGQGGVINPPVQVTVSSISGDVTHDGKIVARADGTIEALFTGTPGATYVIERTIDLTDPEGWDEIATGVVGDDGLIPALDPAPPEDKAFYRARITTP